MPKCAVKNCQNNTLRKRKQHGISYFRFPQNVIQREKWRLIIKEERIDEHFKPNNSSVVCSDHFTESDMYYTENGFRRINKNAVPKIQFLNTQDVPEQSHENMSGENSLTEVESQLRSEASTSVTDRKALFPKSTKCANVSQGPNDLQDNNEEEPQTWSPPTYSQNLPTIARVYLYLEKEYEYMKSLNGDICDLSPLADILKRTAEATGTSEENVITILKTEDLSHHLPERAKTKRAKTREDSSELNSEHLTEDHHMLQDDNDTNVQDETIGYAVYEHEPKPTGSDDNCGTLDTTRAQVKVKVNDDETMSANRLFLEVSPLDITSEAVKSIEPDAEGTEVKLEDEDDPLRQIYCNRHRGDMKVENYTFIISTPNDLTSTSDATDVTVKLEPQDDNCI